MAKELPYTRKQLDKLLKAVFGGEINPSRLPEDLYLKTIQTLSEGVARGFGSGDLTDEMQDLFLHFDHNVAVFSAAKTHQQVADMTRALIDPETKLVRSFSSFKSSAGEIFDQYNKNWLKTEYRTALNQGFGAREWLEFQKDKEFFPVLRYQTANDERVRKDHVVLDNIVRPINDPFWTQYFPPNGWNCRCDVTQHETDEFELTSDKALSGLGAPSKLFKGNPGIDKTIFDPEHPYISKVAERYHVLRSNNFNLPLPPKPPTIKRKAKAPPVRTEADKFKPKAFDDITGIEMPAGFWGLFKPGLKITTNPAKGATQYAGTINIPPSKRYLKGSRGMRRVIAHEFGHAFHYQNRFLRRHMPVDPDFEAMFVRHRKETFGHGMRGKKRAEIIRKTQTATRSKEAVQKVSDAAGFVWDSAERRDSLGLMQDVVGSFTMGKQGGGHSMAYYKSGRGYGGRAEVFAHMFDIVVNGDNPFMTAFFPELQNDMKKMYKTLTKKIKK
tara:strand:- start:581 stop:2077 length:1497 start_codon:yes stop_codon:yes gene_type:complete